MQRLSGISKTISRATSSTSGKHDVTIEEAEEVLLDPQSGRALSRTSGLPTAFGWTSTGRHIAVVYELVDENPLTLRPVTAYDVPPPAPKKKGRKR